jgi:hypothetical protein
MILSRILLSITMAECVYGLFEVGKEVDKDYSFSIFLSPLMLFKRAIARLFITELDT